MLFILPFFRHLLYPFSPSLSLLTWVSAYKTLCSSLYHRQLISINSWNDIWKSYTWLAQQKTQICLLHLQTETYLARKNGQEEELSQFYSWPTIVWYERFLLQGTCCDANLSLPTSSCCPCQWMTVKVKGADTNLAKVKSRAYTFS